METATLFSEGGSTKYIDFLPVTALAHSAYNPRRARGEEAIQRLAERMQRNGYEVTRAVWAHQVNSHYEVFAGGTRLEAARAAGLSKIPVVVHIGYTDADIVRLAELDNENDEYHEPVSIVDVWASYKALADADWTQQQIADAKGCSQAFVSMRLKLANLPQSVLVHFITNDYLKEGHAREIVGLSQSDNLAPWLTQEAAMLEILTATDGTPTAQIFANKVKTYNAFIARAQEFADGLSPQPRGAFLQRLESTNARSIAAVKDAEGRISYAIAEQKRKADEEARLKADVAAQELIAAEREARIAREREHWFSHTARLICGDLAAASREIEPESVDLIFTDPPYDEGAIQSYGDLASLAARILKPGGSLICYAGHYALPDIFPLMTPHLRFWWTLALEHTGNSARLPGKWVFVGWKPLLWFVKDSRRDNEYISDLFRSKQPDKTLHPWQQDVSEALYFIEHLTSNGDLVLDPFCGSGTTLIAGVQIGRRVIGIDRDPAALETSRERLDEYYTKGYAQELLV